MIAFLDAVDLRAKDARKYLEQLGITSWGDVNEAALEAFRDLLRENLCQNTVRELCAQLKSVIIHAGEPVTMPKGWRTILTTPREHPIQPYLTGAEIRRLARLTPSDPIDKRVLYRFLVQCRTGASLCDVARLTPENVVNRGWYNYLIYTNSATKNQAKIGIGDQTLEWLRYLWSNPGDHETYADTYRENRRIVKMLRAASIYDPTTVPIRGTNKTKTVPKWQVVTNRTTRISLCTNLYKAHVDMFTIGEMIGIQGIENVKHYISIRNLGLSSAARVYLGL